MGQGGAYPMAFRFRLISSLSKETILIFHVSRLRGVFSQERDAASRNLTAMMP